MKLIFAIVNNNDKDIVSSQLIKAGFHITKIASTGGFLKKGNNTFITVVDDQQVDQVIEIIKKYSQKRTYSATSDAVTLANLGADVASVQVSFGGATIFVANVERFERI